MLGARAGALEHETYERRLYLNAQMSQMTSNATDFRYGKDVRLYKMRGAYRAFYNGCARRLKEILDGLLLRVSAWGAADGLALLAFEVATILLTARAAISGAIPVERLVFYLSALWLFTSQLLALADNIVSIRTESLFMGDTLDLLEAPIEPAPADAGEREFVDGDVVFDHVWFRYPGTKAWVLEDFSMTIPKGTVTALVGVNGAGKTTVVKLLTGLYLPERGAISIGGVDIREYSQKTLASRFGVVFQQVEPIAATVAENVAWKTGRIDRARAEDCLRKAGLWEKVSSLPRGMDTMLLRVLDPEGAVLSGGENQKLAIARALYREADILVLDEPTAALDALAEEKIYREFGDILSGRTGLFISHRLASTRFCDRIVLLDGGRSRQEGTHDELVSVDGPYRTMYETQAAYYKEEAHA